jgi:adenylyltransferase/sulfurtransferase
MDPLSRYQRQILLPQIGPEGQKRIAASSVAVVGVGALGSVSANLLARAGAGRLLLIDRDFLELNNLQRQVLFDEEDLRENLPKAVAAQRKLQKINSEIKIEAEPSDLNPETIDELLEGIDLVIDGTDNFETRFLLNDFSLREKIPWIYGAAVGTEGLTYVVLPGEGPCLRCLFEAAPKPGEFQTCDTAGILAPVAHAVASFQVMEALKILVGKKDEVDRRLWKIDLWKKEFRPVDVGAGFPRLARGRGNRAPTNRCSGCEKGEYSSLTRGRASRTVTLCGRNAVQILCGGSSRVNFQNLAGKLAPLGAVKYNDYLLKASIAPFEITVFQNGRTIIQGTEDTGQAKSVYAKYIGG